MLDLALVLGKQLTVMAIYLAIGFILVRIGVFDFEGTKQLTTLVLYVVTPLLTLSCFNFEYSPQVLGQFFLTAVLGMGIFIISIPIAYIAKIKVDKHIEPTERFGIVFSNSGFIGTPLTIFALGTIGGFYSSAFSVAFNIMNWTYGVTILGRVKKGKGVLGFLKMFNNPFFYCLGIGLVMYIFQWHFPAIIQTAVDGIGSMTSPLAMILCGLYLGQGNPFKAFKHPRVYFLCLIRLFIVPAVIGVILVFIHVDKTMALTLMIAAAAPMASSTIFFSNDSESRLQAAKEFFLLSTLLSIVTMPVVVGFASKFL